MKPIYAVLILTIPIWSKAVPVKYNECSKNVSIKEVPGSSGYFFNEDCTKVYVLPPRTGLMDISDYRPNPNMDTICSRLASIEKEQNNFQLTQELNSERIVNYTKEVMEKEQNLREGLLPLGKTVDQVQSEIEALWENIDKLKEKSVKWDQQYYTKKEEIAKRQGGSGVFAIVNPYTELLKAYKEANPDFTFEKMPLDQSFVSINEQMVDESNAGQMPAVLKLSANGLGQLPILNSASMMLINKDLVPYQPPKGTVIFGEGVGGEIQMSNIGACAIREHLGDRKEFRAGELDGYISATATYQYQVQVTRKHAISYDIQELVRQIHEQTKRGGLFSRKTLNSFVDERQTTSWIDFKAESQDVRFEYTDEYIKEIKSEFIDRALAQVVAIQTGSPNAVLALIDPKGKNGADEAGDALAKCPHVYCQIGAAGFKVLSAIFGSEKAVSNLLKTLKGRAGETVTEKRMVLQTGTLNFN